jgi:hypothetical protein
MNNWTLNYTKNKTGNVRVAFAQPLLQWKRNNALCFYPTLLQ